DVILLFCFFFFQAEDGIRDRNVTGVQTCALPISSRCHWCRHVLTINEQVPNGVVPDAVLPFSLTHEQAVKAIEEFAGKRKFFARSEERRVGKECRCQGCAAMSKKQWRIKVYGSVG